MWITDTTIEEGTKLMLAEAAKLVPDLETDMHTGAWTLCVGEWFIYASPFWEAQNLAECTSITLSASDESGEVEEHGEIPFLPLETPEASAKAWHYLVLTWAAEKLGPKSHEKIKKLIESLESIKELSREFPKCSAESLLVEMTAVATLGLKEAGMRV